MTKFPTFRIDENGLYCVQCAGMEVKHEQLWQAEAMLHQLARSQGIELPELWYRYKLGFRSRPAA